MMVKVTYNHCYPLNNRHHEWHNYNKTEAFDIDSFTVKAIQEAIDKHEGDSSRNKIINCTPVMLEE